MEIAQNNNLLAFSLFFVHRLRIKRVFQCQKTINLVSVDK